MDYGFHLFFHVNGDGEPLVGAGALQAKFQGAVKG